MLKILSISASAFLLGLAYSSTVQAEPDPDWVSPIDYINVGGASVGTTAYQLVIKFADIWTNDVPGLSANAAPGSGNGNGRDLAENRLGAGMISATVARDVSQGLGGFQQYEGLRYLLPWQESHYAWVVRADSDIYSMEDFVGKHIMPGVQGSTSQTVGLALLEAVGITPENIGASGGRFSFGAAAQSVTAMQDGQLDVILITVPRRGVWSPILPVIERRGVRLIPIGEEALANAKNKVPSLGRGSIDPGVYPGQDEAYDTVTEVFFYAVREDLPEDLAYRMTKAIWDRSDEIVSINPHFFAFEDFSALEAAPIELHPGAKRYYDEERQ